MSTSSAATTRPVQLTVERSEPRSIFISFLWGLFGFRLGFFQPECNGDSHDNQSAAARAIR
jgi:hypothetical protein